MRSRLVYIGVAGCGMRRSGNRIRVSKNIKKKVLGL